MTLTGPGRTRLAMPHFTLEQRAFLSRQLELGVSAGLLVWAPHLSTYWLIQSKEGLMAAGNVADHELTALATWSGTNLHEIRGYFP